MNGGKRCALCGVELLRGRRSDAVFCSGACRAKASRIRREHRDAHHEAQRAAQETYDYLLRAFRRVNARYCLIPAGYEPDMCGPRWLALDAAIDRLYLSGDYEACMRAIDEMERFAFAELSPEAAS